MKSSFLELGLIVLTSYYVEYWSMYIIEFAGCLLSSYPVWLLANPHFPTLYSHPFYFVIQILFTPLPSPSLSASVY